MKPNLSRLASDDRNIVRDGDPLCYRPCHSKPPISECSPAFVFLRMRFGMPAELASSERHTAPPDATALDSVRCTVHQQAGRFDKRLARPRRRTVLLRQLLATFIGVLHLLVI